MIVLDNGTYAGVRWGNYFVTQRELVEREGIAFWVRGQDTVLTSDCYASCVGLALSGDVQGYGAVVHFWDPAGLENAKTIVGEYMDWLAQRTGGYCGDDVEAVVFGGYQKDSTTGARKTVPRMKAIQEYLESRWEMRVLIAVSGSRTVSLDLRNPGPIENQVTLEFGKLGAKQNETSLSPRSKANQGSKGHKRTPSQ